MTNRHVLITLPAGAKDQSARGVRGGPLIQPHQELAS